MYVLVDGTLVLATKKGVVGGVTLSVGILTNVSVILNVKLKIVNISVKSTVEVVLSIKKLIRFFVHYRSSNANRG